MVMAQLLNIRMPGTYEVTFPPQNPDLPGVDGAGRGPDQSGRHLNRSDSVLGLWVYLIVYSNKV